MLFYIILNFINIGRKLNIIIITIIITIIIIIIIITTIITIIITNYLYSKLV